MRRTFGQLLLSLALFTPVVSLVGCAEMFATVSRESNEEGMRLYHQKMYGDATGAFRNAVKQEPRDYQSHFYLAVCYDELKQHQPAFQQYRLALEMMNTTAEGRHDDEFRQLALDAYASAVARYDDREVELNQLEKTAGETQAANDWFLVAKVYRLGGDADSAITAYRNAANINKWDFYIRKEIGLYLLDPLGQRQESCYYLQQAYRLNPNDYAVNTGLTRLGVNPLPAYQAADPAVQPPVQSVPVNTPGARSSSIQQVSTPQKPTTATLPRD